MACYHGDIETKERRPLECVRPLEIPQLERGESMLNNTTREALLQAESGNTALVIDALYHTGYTMFQQFTYHQAQKSLSWLQVNPYVLRAGLKHPVFGQKRLRNAIYTLPAPSSVQRAVNARKSAISDVLPDSAFQSLHQYRRALHHALLVRRPGNYARGWLADRVAVVKRTTRNYDHADGHFVTVHMSQQYPLTWSMLPQLPTARQPAGKAFLVVWDETGAWVDHYAPLLQSLAAHWLARGRRVDYAEQGYNHYAHEHPGLKYVSGKYAEFIEH